MRIGIAKADPQTGRISATIAAPGLTPFTLELHRVENPRDRSPDWELRHAGERCGALWKRKARESGVEFLSGPLESPVFPGGKIEIAVWKAKDEGRRGELDLTWNPPRGEERSGGGERSATQGAAPAAAAEDEDDIPF